MNKVSYCRPILKSLSVNHKFLYKMNVCVHTITGIYTLLICTYLSRTCVQTPAVALPARGVFGVLDGGPQSRMSI